MSFSRDSRAERKLKLLLRSEFRLKQGFQRIDFEEDILMPQIADLKAGRAVLNLPEGSQLADLVLPEHHETDSPRTVAVTAGPKRSAKHRRRAH